ncbi:HNH endonuclease signature motif containing protein [Nocardia acidivorans]|uniref:HNH endonuclease signature motif containing protein n=1 Tax=Nocardia acidivorans TaxID=404580 RepID=UPI000830F0D6|nr:HNH endonuclease signature motif containing protein [Nocardia acidivorans]
MESGGDTAIVVVVQALRAAADALLSASPIPLSDDEFIALMRETETVARQLDAVKTGFVDETRRRDLHGKANVKSPALYLEQSLRLSRADACRRVRVADKLAVRRLPGQVLEPELPVVAQAHRAGEISADHVTRILQTMDRLPGSLDIEKREAAEVYLAEYASTGWPDDVRKLGEDILRRVDPDGKLCHDTDRQRMRGLTIGTQRVDGMSALIGEITPELRAVFEPLLAKLARPGMCNPEDPESPRTTAESADRERLEAAAQRDTRTAAQRNHDALLAFLRYEADPAILGTHRGLPVGTLLTMSLTDLENRSGVATTATGGTLSIGEAVQLAANSTPYLAVFDDAGMPLHLGRGNNRLANKAQRLALVAAEKGCTRPNCTAPATLSAVHHVTEWSKGGRTDIENLTLACDSCHALIHDGPGGWKTVKLGAGSQFPGRTGWIAPPHINPSRTPEVNHRHHPGELMAATVSRIQSRNEAERQRLKQWLNCRRSGEFGSGPS